MDKKNKATKFSLPIYLIDISEIIINKTLPRKTLVLDLVYVNLSFDDKINVETNKANNGI